MHHTLLDKLLQANLYVAPGPPLVIWVPAIVVFSQAQLKGIRSVGMIGLQKDSGRVPGQAGPIHDICVGLSSVKVTIPIVAGF